MTEVTSLLKPPEEITEKAVLGFYVGSMEMHIMIFYRNNVNAKCLFDNCC